MRYKNGRVSLRTIVELFLGIVTLNRRKLVRNGRLNLRLRSGWEFKHKE